MRAAEGGNMIQQQTIADLTEGRLSDEAEGTAAGGIIECPFCAYPVPVRGDQARVRCPSCGNNISVSASRPDPREDIARKVAEIKTLTAAQAHIDYVFSTFDWDAFNCNASVYSIPEIDALLSNMRIANGDNPDLWKLCFAYKSRCIESKLDGIGAIRDEIVEKYMRGDDPESCYNEYDSLYESVDILRSKRAELVDSLLRYVSFAEKYGLAEGEGAAWKAKAAALGERIGALDLVGDLRELPAVAEKLREQSEAVEKAYAEAGINAPAEYEAAVRAYERKDYDGAAERFARIPEFCDARDYMERINSVFVLGRKYFYMNGRIFFYNDGLCYEKDRLVDDLLPETLPFASYIGCYGSKFFYMAQNDSRPAIYYKRLDVREAKKKKKVKASGVPNASADKREMQNRMKIAHGVSAYGTLEYVGTPDSHPELRIYRAKYDPVREAAAKAQFCKANGFASKLKVGKKQTCTDWGDLLAFDMKSCAFRILAEGVLRVKAIHGNAIYYVAYGLDLKKNGVVQAFGDESLYSCDLATGATRRLLNGDSSIEEFCSDRSIVFTRTDHGENNLTIYTKQNADNAPEIRIVKNVYKYYRMIGSKIYFLMGNEKIKSLCSVNLDGSDRREVMKYMLDIEFTLGDWIYVTRGDASSQFCTLYRISIEGGEPQKVAFGIRRRDLDAPLIQNGYLYYTDNENGLCRVRLNGTGKQALVQGVWSIVLIKYGKVFYLSDDGQDNGHNVYSLYEMDLDGSNRNKLVYNIESLCKIDDRRLLYVRENRLDSKREVYAYVQDEKLNALISKIYYKYDKKKKYPHNIYRSISVFDCETGSVKQLAFDCSYPDPKALKLEMKEVLKG